VGRSLGEMAGRLDVRQYVSGDNSQCSGNIDKLDNVNSSLSVLIFGDKGLWFAQHLCHVALRHPFRLAGVRELDWRSSCRGVRKDFGIRNEAPLKKRSSSGNPELGLSQFGIIADIHGEGGRTCA
jgi:hypothetical protein